MKNRNLQNKLNQLFNIFINICNENSLEYYILGGTMLGAVRHNGFIPWDDDIDIGMPRKDYQKFLEIMKNSKDRRVHLKIGYESEDLVFPYSKLLDCSTTLIENRLGGIVEGIYIDVFPLDGLGNCLTKRIHFYKFFFFQGCLYYKQESKKRNNLIKNIIQKVVNIIPIEFFIKKLQKIEIKYDFDNSKYVGNLSGNWGYREIMKKDIYGAPVIYTFENLNVYGVEKPHLYLSRMYGNYLQLPPKEARVTHHDYIFLDLEKSYLEFENKERKE